MADTAGVSVTDFAGYANDSDTATSVRAGLGSGGSIFSLARLFGFASETELVGSVRAAVMPGNATFAVGFFDTVITPPPVIVHEYQDEDSWGIAM